MLIQCGAHQLDLSVPRIMGVLNVTPDSFYDGGALYRDGHLDLDVALIKASNLVDEGADIIDVGGESTRPGAQHVSEQEELDRVAPVVNAITSRFDVLVSVDTSAPMVISESAKAGAGMINDVRALTRPNALQEAASTGMAVCLMHMQGAPQTMQDKPHYPNVVSEVCGYLQSRIDACVTAGIGRERLIVDPGIGFGKNDDHNLALLKQLSEFCQLAPVLLGVSRKSLFGRLLGRPLEERLAAGLAVALLAVQQGVSILRVHDVAQTRDVLRMWQYLQPTCLKE